MLSNNTFLSKNPERLMTMFDKVSAAEIKIIQDLCKISSVGGCAEPYSFGMNSSKRMALHRLIRKGLVHKVAGAVHHLIYQLTPPGIQVATELGLACGVEPVLNEITVGGYLSYSDIGVKIKLGRLNVIIGPNGVGKSNLIDAVALLQSSTRDLQLSLRKAGGIDGLLHKGAESSQEAIIESVVSLPLGAGRVVHRMALASNQGVGCVTRESLTRVMCRRPIASSDVIFRLEGDSVSIRGGGRMKRLAIRTYDRTQSVFAQRRDPESYPELTQISNVFSAIRIYRNWHFGRDSAVRQPGRTDLPSDGLLPDCSNLGLVLNFIARYPSAKRQLILHLQELYHSITDYSVEIMGSTVQVYLMEGDIPIPLTRLSDGTLRYLCILSVLCHPKPPPLVCIEEPELGLHPDVLPHLGELLWSASERVQLIVTTHSDILIDSLSDHPEAVLVAERNPEGTSLTRLDAKALQPWLEKYRLGTMWLNGHLGGLRT